VAIAAMMMKRRLQPEFGQPFDQEESEKAK
jgi:hypothetical protein